MWRPARIISDKLHTLAEPVARVVARTGVPPNALTILGLFINAVAAWLLATGHFPLGGLVILIAGAFDLLDGAVARVTGKSTTFGALLDSSVDRYSEAVLLFGLIVYFALHPGTLEMSLIFATIVGSLLVSYVRARAEGLGLDAEVGIMRRTVRILTLALGLMLSPIEHALVVILWILAIGTNLTAMHRLLYVWRKTRGKG
jgi:CDP-diacylglycerol--glycerol-3-phosphate 3-phosphatidyltransferase